MCHLRLAASGRTAPLRLFCDNFSSHLLDLLACAAAANDNRGGDYTTAQAASK